MFSFFAFKRLWAMIVKEFIQMQRDRGTFSMIIGLPLVQLIVFGFAINNDPKFLSTVIIDNDKSVFSRAFIQGMKSSNYFKVILAESSEKQAEYDIKTRNTQFIINIPSNFSKQLIRGAHPNLLLQSDATDPVATSNATAAIKGLAQNVYQDLFRGSLSYLQPPPPPFDLIVHAQYNPEGITQFNVVPGLAGVVITMTLSMITAIGITREKERGTMENLLATPIQPTEVMLGKVAPYIIVGYIQLVLILIAAKLMFNVPMEGNIFLLMLVALPFMIANLSVGLAMSSVAKNQLQSTQMTTFYFLPSILLSGFLFPFDGMPLWARALGEMLPMTHFIRITRGILLKGNGLAETWPDIWPILLFLIAVLIIGVKSYRKTLD